MLDLQHSCRLVMNIRAVLQTDQHVQLIIAGLLLLHSILRLQLCITIENEQLENIMLLERLQHAYLLR
jgi:hypothetical protein